MRQHEVAFPVTGDTPVGKDASGACWRKARRSGAENGGCVEILGGLTGLAGIRDSCCPDAGAHLVSTAAFAAFLRDAKAGAYDVEAEQAE